MRGARSPPLVQKPLHLELVGSMLVRAVHGPRVEAAQAVDQQQLLLAGQRGLESGCLAHAVVLQAECGQAGNEVNGSQARSPSNAACTRAVLLYQSRWQSAYLNRQLALMLQQSKHHQRRHRLLLR